VRSLLIPDPTRALNPHFSPALYCGGGSGHVYCVALGLAPRRTVEYASGALGLASCIHAPLCRLATIPGEKSGLRALSIGTIALRESFRAGHRPNRLNEIGKQLEYVVDFLHCCVTADR